MCLFVYAEGYNKYVELIGGAIGVGACAAVRQGNKIYTIDDDIPLLHFLTGQLLNISNYTITRTNATHFWREKRAVQFFVRVFESRRTLMIGAVAVQVTTYKY